MIMPLSNLGGSVDLSSLRRYGMSDVCKGCGKKEFVDDSVTGDRICTNCGVVNQQSMLSEEPEWSVLIPIAPTSASAAAVTHIPYSFCLIILFLPRPCLKAGHGLQLLKVCPAHRKLGPVGQQDCSAA